MASFTAIPSANEIGLQLYSRSSDLDAQTSPPALNCAKDSPTFGAGPRAGNGVVSVVSWNTAGTKHGMFDAQLFERVIVVPRAKSLGFVLSTITFPVEVWNTYQSSMKTLNTISISGGGITLSGGLGSPATYGPGQSSTYTVTVAQDGPASLTNVVTFNFAGSVTGADLSITGSRITAFSPEIDWSDGFDETASWLTQVMKAYSDMEQRVQLRTVPRYSAEFRVLTTTALETTGLSAMLYAQQARMFGVPWWPDASTLNAGLSPGANSLAVDTTLRPAFEIGGLVMIWSDIFSWEALTIQSLTGSSITLQSPVTKTWPAGTQVVPLKRGRLKNQVPLDRPSSLTASLKVAFDCEVA